VAGEGGLTVLLYNHDTPTAALQEEQVLLRLEGLRSRRPARLVRIDARHANPKARWQALGSPEYPSQADLAQIARLSRPGASTIRPAAGEQGCVFLSSAPGWPW
jgi:xylan 1,4-beta-xylosidase